VASRESGVILPRHTDSSGGLRRLESRVQGTQLGEHGAELRRRALGLPFRVLFGRYPTG